MSPTLGTVTGQFIGNGTSAYTLTYANGNYAPATQGGNTFSLGVGLTDTVIYGIVKVLGSAADVEAYGTTSLGLGFVGGGFASATDLGGIFFGVGTGITTGITRKFTRVVIPWGSV